MTPRWKELAMKTLKDRDFVVSITAQVSPRPRLVQTRFGPEPAPTIAVWKRAPAPA